MTSFGEQLRAAREARGVPLDAITRVTRIAERYLLALERGDLGALPGGAFDRGYIRSYAQFLDIDAEPILEAYRGEEQRLGRGTPDSERRELQEMAALLDRRSAGGRRSRSVSVSRSTVRLVFAAVAIAMVSWGVWSFLRARNPISPPAIPPTPEPAAPEGSPPAPNEPEPNERTGADATRLRIADAGVGTGVADHALVGKGHRFPEGTRVAFLTRVTGGEAGEAIRHVWLFEGRTVMRARLNLGGPHWRTYSSYALAPGSAGNWTVEARTADERVLAREEFLCVPGGDADAVRHNQ